MISKFDFKNLHSRKNLSHPHPLSTWNGSNLHSAFHPLKHFYPTTPQSLSYIPLDLLNCQISFKSVFSDWKTFLVRTLGLYNFFKILRLRDQLILVVFLLAEDDPYNKRWNVELYNSTIPKEFISCSKYNFDEITRNSCRFSAVNRINFFGIYYLFVF